MYSIDRMKLALSGKSIKGEQSLSIEEITEFILSKSNKTNFENEILLKGYLLKQDIDNENISA